jgi:hypothetical protein
MQILDDWTQSRHHNDFYTTFEDYTDTILKYYGVPSLSMRNALHNLVQLNESGFGFDDIWGDHLHPSEVGHGYLAYIVLDYFSLMIRETKQLGGELDQYVDWEELPPPLFPDNHHHKGSCGMGHELTDQVRLDSMHI